MKYPIDKKIIPHAPHHFYIGLFVAFFSFFFVWDFYPVTGMIGTLVGIVITIDDIIEHVFYHKTPLRLFFEGILIKYLK